MRAVFPTPAVIVLMGIGLVDLVSTAWLYHAGLIYERNPLMRPLLQHGEWLFVLVKGATLGLAWLMLARYARQNLQFVQRSCWVGSAAYAMLWVGWFMAK